MRAGEDHRRADEGPDVGLLDEQEIAQQRVPDQRQEADRLQQRDVGELVAVSAGRYGRTCRTVPPPRTTAGRSGSASARRRARRERRQATIVEVLPDHDGVGRSVRASALEIRLEAEKIGVLIRMQIAPRPRSPKPGRMMIMAPAKPTSDGDPAPQAHVLAEEQRGADGDEDRTGEAERGDAGQRGERQADEPQEHAAGMDGAAEQMERQAGWCAWRGGGRAARRSAAGTACRRNSA